MNQLTYMSILGLRNIFILGTVLLLGLVAYWPSFHAPFQLDDTAVITALPILEKLTHLGDLWSYDPSRFLTHLTFALNYKGGEVDPYTYHVVNFSLHVLITLVAFFFIKQVVHLSQEANEPKQGKFVYITFFATCIFLIHPVQTSTVTYVIQRATLLATLFYLLTVIFYLTSRQTLQRSYYVWAIICACLGIFTKPIFITLPLALLAVELFLIQDQRAVWLRSLKSIWPFILIVSMIPILLTLWKYGSLELGQLASMTKESTKYSRLEYFITQWVVLVMYIRILLMPILLRLDYDLPVATFPSFESITALVCLVLCFILIVRLYKKNRLMSFALTWIFLTLSLESSIFPIADLAFEHRLYLPMAGFAMIWPVVLDKLVKHPATFNVLMTIVIIVFAFLSYQRNLIWSNNIRFHENEALFSPKKPRVWVNLGLAHINEGNYKQAINVLNKVLTLDASNMKAYHNKAVAYFHLGQFDKALVNIMLAIEKDSQYGASYGIRGDVYQKMGRFEEAIADYAKAIELKSNYFEAYNNRGLTYALMNKYDLAIDDYFEALRIRPRDIEAKRNRGNAYVASGQFELAMNDYEQILEIAPQDALTYNSKGILYIMQSDFNGALDSFNKALAFNDQYDDAYFNRGKLYFDTNQFQLAQRDFNRTLKNNQDYAPAYYYRALVHASKLEFEQALKDIEKAEALNFPLQDGVKEEILKGLHQTIKKPELGIIDN